MTVKRQITIEDGEVFDDVTDAVPEKLSVAERKRLADDPARKRRSTDRRIHIHTPGNGYRVVDPDDIEEDILVNEHGEPL